MTSPDPDTRPEHGDEPTSQPAPGPVGEPRVDLPRHNGELVFDAPWESRAFGLAAAYLQVRGEGWDRFRGHLIAAIAALPPETPYYEAWTTAFEALLADDGVADPAFGAQRT